MARASSSLAAAVCHRHGVFQRGFEGAVRFARELWRNRRRGPAGLHRMPRLGGPVLITEPRSVASWAKCIQETGRRLNGHPPRSKTVTPCACATLRHILRKTSAAAVIPPSVRNASLRSERTPRHNWCLARHDNNRAHQGFRVRPRGGSHVDANSATAPASAAARRTASARRGRRDVGGGLRCRAHGRGGAASVAGRERRGKRLFRRPFTRSAEQRRQPPSDFVTAILSPQLTAEHGKSVSLILSGAR